MYQKGTVKTLGGEFTAKPREKGTLGRAIKLRTNHYKLSLPKAFTVHQYDIDLKKAYNDSKNQDGKDDKTVKLKCIMR